MALTGQIIEEITELHSHPMAIAQCRKFLKQHPHIKLIESTDTALSAKWVSDENLVGVAAIASSQAASMYDLEILAAGIETNKKNYTRFLILDRNDSAIKHHHNNKFSVSFSLANNIGSLSQILNILAEQGANLTKIQSVPLVGKEWQYIFFIDFVLGNNLTHTETINALKTATKELKILGNYATGKYHDS